MPLWTLVAVKLLMLSSLTLVILNTTVIGSCFLETLAYPYRELQAQAVVHRMEDKKKDGQDKVVWLGYLTDRPGTRLLLSLLTKIGGPNYNKLINAGLVDVSPKEEERYCLYLFHMGMEISNFEVT